MKLNASRKLLRREAKLIVLFASRAGAPFGLSPKWLCDECGLPIPDHGRCECCGRKYWVIEETV